MKTALRAQPQISAHLEQAPILKAEKVNKRPASNKRPLSRSNNLISAQGGKSNKYRQCVGRLQRRLVYISLKIPGIFLLKNKARNIASVFGGGERAGKCHSSSATAVFMFTAGSHPMKRLRTRDSSFTKKDKALIHPGGGKI